MVGAMQKSIDMMGEGVVKGRQSAICEYAVSSRRLDAMAHRLRVLLKNATIRGQENACLKANLCNINLTR